MFRPCIDLHAGKVKQIVGGTYTDAGDRLETRFVSARDAAWYARMFQRDGLRGGHLILIGPGNEEAATSALAAYPDGLQVGGGMHAGNARSYLDRGASHVIVTSWLFPGGVFSRERLLELKRQVGSRHLVLDLSCRRKGDNYFIVTNRWQTMTDQMLSPAWIAELEPSCAEFLIHAVDVEGMRAGLDEQLVTLLSGLGTLPITYAGGAKSIADLRTVETLGKGRIHLTIGSALDIFGGDVSYEEAVLFNRSLGAG